MTAKVAIKDALTGAFLGEATTDVHGHFSVPVASAPSVGLVQVVAAKGMQVVQALAFIGEGGKRSSYQLASTSAFSDVTVDWASTVIAQTLGAKIAEAFLIDSGDRLQARLILTEAKTIEQELSLEAKSIDDALQRGGLSRLQTRERVVALVERINDSLVYAFREGRSPIFSPRPVVFTKIGIDISPPAITIDRAKGEVVVVYNGKREIVPLPLSGILPNGSDLPAKMFDSPRVQSSHPGDSSLDQTGVDSPPLGASAGGGIGPGDSPQGGSENTKHTMWISKVVLTDSGESIVGEQAPSSISYSPEGKSIRLTLHGKLNAEHPPTVGLQDYTYPAFPFQGLLQQTFADNLPHRRVLLDNSILLPLDPAAEVSDHKLTVVLNTKALVDLAVSKLHTISVVDRESIASIQVKVANRVPVSGLQPIITRAEIVKDIKFRARPGKAQGIPLFSTNAAEFSLLADKWLGGNEGGRSSMRTSHEYRVSHDSIDDGENGKYLMVEGYNFPVSIYLHWASINGERVYSHATWITDEAKPRSLMFLHLGDNIALRDHGLNNLSYANPFGFSMISF